MPSERDFLHHLRLTAQRRCPELQIGIGDDAALITARPGRHLVVMSDALVEDVHFRRRYVPAAAIGHKALAVNLSDCAAMGATPRFCLLSFALPPSAQPLGNDIVQGLLSLADRTQVILVGGDTTTSPQSIFVDVCLIGDIAPGCTITRAGAQPDDALFISGTIGAAAAALQAFEQGATPPDVASQTRFLFPEPRLELGQYLATHHLATAMLDVSDGLSLDLARLCEASRVGAVLEAAALPIAPAAVAGTPDQAAARRLALEGGEDYELLFTVPPQHMAAVAALSGAAAIGGVTLTHIGRITDDNKLLLHLNGETQPLPLCGYDHFARLEGRSVATAETCL
ncbi:MAG: thiamine-phosphate kinase [Acidobacteriota bacterium]